MTCGRRRTIVGACVLALILKIPPVAALTVYDPWNHAENVLSAARALEQIENQITSLQNEAQMLINQGKQLASLPTSVLGKIEGNFAEIQDLLLKARGVAYDVQSLEQEFRQSYESIGSNLTDRQLLDGARERWQASVSAFEHALTVGAGAVEGLPQTQAQASTLVNASQSAVGVVQAAQAGNQLLAVQTRQLADLTAILAAQGRADAMEQARQATAQEQAREQFRRFMTPRGYQPSAVNMFHD